MGVVQSVDRDNRFVPTAIRRMEVVVVDLEEDGEDDSSLEGAKSSGAIVVGFEDGIVVLDKVLVFSVGIFHGAIFESDDGDMLEGVVALASEELDSWRIGSQTIGDDGDGTQGSQVETRGCLMEDGIGTGDGSGGREDLCEDGSFFTIQDGEEISPFAFIEEIGFIHHPYGVGMEWEGSEERIEEISPRIGPIEDSLRREGELEEAVHQEGDFPTGEGKGDEAEEGGGDRCEGEVALGKVDGSGVGSGRSEALEDVQTDRIVSPGVALSFLETIRTVGVGALEFVEFLAFGLQVDPSSAVGTAEGKMLSSFERDPLPGADFAAILLDGFAQVREQDGGVGVDIRGRSPAVRTGKLGIHRFAVTDRSDRFSLLLRLLEEDTIVQGRFQVGHWDGR